MSDDIEHLKAVVLRVAAAWVAKCDRVAELEDWYQALTAKLVKCAQVERGLREEIERLKTAIEEAM